MFQRDSNSIQIILAYGREKGLREELLLAGSDLSQTELSHKQVQPQQELKILSNLLQHTPDPIQTGIELGSRYQLTSYGIMGYALLASENVRAAIELGIKYLGLSYAFSEIAFVENQQEFSLEFTTQLPADLGQMVLLRDIWGALVIQYELFCAQSVPISLELTVSADENLNFQGLDKLLQAGIHFNKSHNRFVGPAALLDLALLRANPNTFNQCQQQCQQLLDARHQTNSLKQQVEKFLLDSNMQGSMQQLARQLGQSERTLHRQLTQHNTSWSELKQQLRLALAKQLLDSPLKLEDIAYRLGFSDAANFSHSFKRSTGVSPRVYRQTQLKME